MNEPKERNPIEELIATRMYLCKKEGCKTCPAMYLRGGKEMRCALSFVAYLMLGLEERGYL
ncbi:hypothetical protein [Megasphaera massiliensis]|uniref:hypothetical protein n=1 Tax=Megasphaera massiliensis TaxID=1232428 RepID=UPI0012B59705|nr:hypothetical protein [Megasphaera massiliensis]